jgi:hypothetical protein
VPGELGYYNLLDADIRKKQAGLARYAGIEGFCYWHYWFGGGKQLLQRPFNEVLASGKPDFPFALGWANHSWKTNTWTHEGKQRNEMIVEQRYLGTDDYRQHFEYVLPAFKDHRYITIDGKPLFVVFNPYDLPLDFIPTWRTWAKEAGLKCIHFVGYMQNTNGRPIVDEKGEKITNGMFAINEANKYYDYTTKNLKFDAVLSLGTWRAEACVKNRWWVLFQRQLSYRTGISLVNKYDYKRVMEHYYVPEDAREDVYPSLLPQWDRSPRAGLNGIYHNSTPERFAETIKRALQLIEKKQPEHRILFLKSWNEWAEGNYVEPDLRYGHGYLDAIHDCIKD